MLIAACGGSGAQPAPLCKTVAGTAAVSSARSGGSWAYSNGDLANTRDVRDGAITAANVSRLKQAWTFKLSGIAAEGVGGSGSLAANPIVQSGVVYLQDLDSNVYAIALGSGKLAWEYECNTPSEPGRGQPGSRFVTERSTERRRPRCSR